MTGRAHDDATIEVRKAHAQAKRERIGQRNKRLQVDARIGAPIWPAEKRVRIRERNRRNMAAQHGHAYLDDCLRCGVTIERMIARGTI